ncbi:MAG: GGDEF domain-containing protein [Actinobacteria bacterium]|nr:GGDEF domain-containing protein [Actinomycetota bacterium]
MVAAVIAAVGMSFHWGQLILFAVLLCCGLGNVEATRRTHYTQGGIVRDMLTVWCLPVAVLLPPFYALIVPGPLMALTQLRVHRGIVYRRVFSAATIALAYAAASLAFRSLPLSVTGPSPGQASHAVRWCLAVAACDVLAWAINNTLIAAAIRSSDPTARIRELFSREALSGDYIQWTVAVLVTLAAAIGPILLAFAWPTVLVLRRGMMHKQLVSRTRIDPKTGLLNAAAWEREADAAITRALRDGAPLAVALVDIDHFKAVNDQHGHLAGDEVLRAISGRFTKMLRAGDLAGRFGGEEFALLFLDAGAADAHRIAERLRESIAQSPISVGAAGLVDTVSVTVSIGVATLDSGTRLTVTDMLAAADSALYRAKNAGRNRTVAVIDTSPPAPLAHGQQDAMASGEMEAGPPDAGGAGLAPGNLGSLSPGSPFTGRGPTSGGGPPAVSQPRRPRRAAVGVAWAGDREHAH